MSIEDTSAFGKCPACNEDVKITIGYGIEGSPTKAEGGFMHARLKPQSAYLHHVCPPERDFVPPVPMPAYMGPREQRAALSDDVPQPSGATNTSMEAGWGPLT